MQVSRKTSSEDVSEEAFEQSFKWYRDFFKRLFDVCFSIIAIVVFAIPMMIVAICIKLDSPHEKVLFEQKRVGIDNKPFTIFKFRSMSADAPHQMATENFENPEQYITKVGKILRKSSLDELPQLFNVLKGDMSIVGPRPLIPKEKYVLELRNSYGASKILPGITGLAQVHGRDQVTDENKAYYDGKYASHVSLLLDATIILKTVLDVVRSRGVREGKK